jgi:hypothetical protein
MLSTNLKNNYVDYEHHQAKVARKVRGPAREMAALHVAQKLVQEDQLEARVVVKGKQHEISEQSPYLFVVSWIFAGEEGESVDGEGSAYT